MRIQKAAVGWLVMACLMCVANTGQAEGLLKRLFGTKDTGQVSSSCPGGMCPTSSAPAAFQSAPVANVVQMPFKAVDNARGHWSYPGTIDSHLESTHGVSTAGMSRQEKLNLHDSLHEGTAQNVAVSVPRANYVAPFVSNYPSYTTQSGGGSTGGLGSVGSRSGGSTGGFGIGTVLPDGAIVTSVGVTQPSQASSLEVTQLRIGDRSSFRKSLLAAGRKARDAGEITSLEFFLLSAASRNPATLEKMQAAVHEAAIEEGLATTQAIDWDSLITFIEKLIPIIIKLIELFGQVTLQPEAQFVSNTPQCSVLDSFHLAA